MEKIIPPPTELEKDKFLSMLHSKNDNIVALSLFQNYGEHFVVSKPAPVVQRLPQPLRTPVLHKQKWNKNA